MELEIKKIFFVMIVLFVFVFFANEVSAGTIIKSPAYLGLSRGLVGCWSFDGSYAKVPDCSGNNNTGTITGATKKVGKIGQALDLDGTNDRMDVGSDTLGTTEMTFSAWVKPHAFVNNDTIFSNNAANDTLLYLETTGGELQFSSNGQTTVAAINLNSALQIDSWSYITIVRNSSNQATFYINGFRTGTINQASGTPGSGSTVTGLGYRARDGADFFNGSVDDVRIYNRALSTSDIERLYRISLGSTANRPNSSLTKGLIGQWNFDGSNISGTRAKDSSGSDNHGTINGALAKIGKVGQALDFDGTDDIIEILDSFNPTAYTITAWIKASDTTARNIFVRTSSSGPLVNWSHVLALDATGRLVHYTWDGADQCTRGTTIFSADTWYFVAGTAVHDGNLKAYVNGLAEGTPDTVGTLDTAGDRYNIAAPVANISGCPDATAPTYFDGLIDDVRIYNRVLSAEEISRLYNSTQSKFNSSRVGSSIDKGLIGCWTFDGSYAKVPDCSGNNNTGTLIGSPVRIAGKIGQAINFDGVDDEVGLSDSLILSPSTGNFTISVWVKWKELPAATDTIIVDHNSTNNDTWELFVTTQNKVDCRYRDNTAIVDATTGEDSIILNQWIHYVCIRVGTTVRLYQDNGTPFTATDAGLLDVDTDGSFTPVIGDFVTGGNDPAAIIDDIRIYNRALSAEEVYKLYSMGR